MKKNLKIHRFDSTEVLNSREAKAFWNLTKQGIEIRQTGVQIKNPARGKLEIHPGNTIFRRKKSNFWVSGMFHNYFYTDSSPEEIFEILKPNVKNLESTDPEWYQDNCLDEEYRPVMDLVNPTCFRIETPDTIQEGTGHVPKIYLRCIKSFDHLAREARIPANSLQVDIHGNVYDPLQAWKALKSKGVLNNHLNCEKDIPKDKYSSCLVMEYWLESRRFPFLKSDPRMIPLSQKYEQKIIDSHQANITNLYSSILRSEDPVPRIQDLIESKILDKLINQDSLKFLQRMINLEKNHPYPEDFEETNLKDLKDRREILIERQNSHRSYRNWLKEYNPINDVVNSTESMKVKIYRYGEEIVWNAMLILAAENKSIRFKDSVEKIRDARNQITEPPSMKKLEDHNLDSSQLLYANQITKEIWLCSNMTLTPETIPVNPILERVRIRYEDSKESGRRISRNLGIL